MSRRRKASKAASKRKAKQDADHRRDDMFADELNDASWDDDADIQLQDTERYDLKWVLGAEKSQRPQFYGKDSDRTKRRRIAELKEAAKGCLRIDQIFASQHVQKPTTREDDGNASGCIRLGACCKSLEDGGRGIRELEKVSGYEHLAILCLDGLIQEEASERTVESW